MPNLNSEFPSYQYEDPTIRVYISESTRTYINKLESIADKENLNESELDELFNDFVENFEKGEIEISNIYPLVENAILKDHSYWVETTPLAWLSSKKESSHNPSTAELYELIDIRVSLMLGVRHNEPRLIQAEAEYLVTKSDWYDWIGREIAIEECFLAARELGDIDTAIYAAKHIKAKQIAVERLISLNTSKALKEAAPLTLDLVEIGMEPIPIISFRKSEIIDLDSIETESIS